MFSMRRGPFRKYRQLRMDNSANSLGSSALHLPYIRVLGEIAAFLDVLGA